MRPNRWFILALGFLLLNGYAVFRWLAGPRSPGHVHAVLAEPENSQVQSGSRDVIHWRFSADMVTPSQTGHWADSGPVRFFPDIKGEFQWIDANRLAFRPAEDWPACIPCSAVFNEGLRSLGGRSLDGNRTTIFNTTPLELLDVRQSNAAKGASVQLDFEFNQPVSPSLLVKHLSIHDAAGTAVGLQDASRQSAHRTIRISLESFTAGELRVTLHKGLSSTAGPLGLVQDEIRRVLISRALRVVHVKANSRPFEAGEVEVIFNAPVEPEQAKEFIRLTPSLPFAVEERDAWNRRQHLRILADFKAGANYTITFVEGLKGDQGIGLESDEVRTVYFPQPSSHLQFPERGTYLSPQGHLSIPFKAVNTGKCTVEIRRIYPNNLVYLAKRQAGRDGYYGPPTRGLDQLVGEFELLSEAPANEIVERTLDLREWLDGKTGAFHITIKGERGGNASQDVVVSDLGLSLRRSGKEMLAWVNSIHTLEAVQGATIRILSEENQLLLSGETDAEGVLRLDPATMPVDGKPFLAVVEKGDDLTYMRFDVSRVNVPGAAGERAYLENGYEAFVFTDRGIYRPGETIHCKAVVRERDAVCPQPYPLELAVVRPDGKTDRKLNGMLNEYGCVEFEVPLVDYVATGKYALQARLPGSDICLGSATVSVEEFVPPQIRASLKVPEGRVAAGEVFGFTVSGQHLFGRPASGMPVSARADFMPCAFAPEAWPDYSFGDARRPFETVKKVLGNKVLDARGEMLFEVETSTRWRPPAAIKAVVSGSVQETGGRTVTAYGSRIIDVYSSYIGIRRPEEALETGRAHTFDLLVVAPDGTRATDGGPLKAIVEKLNWVTVMRQEGDHYAYRSEQQASEIESYYLMVSNGQASVGFTPLHAGSYRLVVEDPGCGTASSLGFGVCAPGQRWEERSLAAPDVVELELDRAAYRIGDAARLSIRSPFPGKALLTVETDQILLHRVMDLTNNTAEVELPVEAGYRPNAYCSVSVVRPALPEEVWGQHRAAGRIPLLVEQPERKLDLSMEMPEEIRPGTRLEIPVQVRDAKGLGCKADLVVAAVDEGICMLTGFSVPDPYDYFFGPRLPGVELHDLYAQLMPEAFDHVAGSPSAPGGGMLSALGKRLNPIKARRFKPVALWSSSTSSDTNGQVRVVFDVPEFTGRLRVMAVAVDSSRFGSSERSVMVKRPLVVQSSLPRFLAPGDAFTVPVRVYNETTRDGEVQVTVACEGPLECGDTAKQVRLAAGGATNLEFRLHAALATGKAICTVSADMGSEHYAEPVEIAVRPAAPRVVLIGCGNVEAGMSEELSVPADWLAGTGEAALKLSGLPNVTLGGSIDYLIDYPYGCLEQTTSKSFPLLYLSTLVEQMRPGWLGRDGTADFVNAGIYRILSMQLSDGGFSLWPNGGVYHWGSVYATHFLVEASRADYDVPKDRLEEALEYVEQKVRNATFDRTDGYYDLSYGCYVLALGGRPQHGAMAWLSERWEVLKYDTRINLVSAMLEAGQRRQAVELLDRLGRQDVNPVPLESGGSLRSAVRCNAFLLSVLLDVDPGNPSVPSLVRCLKDAQTNGRWRNTQESAMALMALGKYTQRLAENQKPVSGVVRWNRGGQTVEFKDRDELKVVLERLQGESVHIENQGKGALYFSWKSEGVPADGETAEYDHGIQIRRALLDSEGQPVDAMNLRQGELYMVKLDLSTDRRMENLVIDDLLPAGLEVENGALKTSQSVAWAHGMQRLSMQHLDMRDDRVIAFPGSFNGEGSYCYAVRAVTSGEFVWPAVSVACMYDASTESVHGKGKVRVVQE